MNRMIILPAGCCLIAYAALFTNLQGTRAESPSGLARVSERGTILVPASSLAPASVPSSHATLLSRGEAEKILHDLQEEYLRPQREWESSPHRLMSRASPGRITPSSAHYVMATKQPGEHELLAAIVIKSGSKPETFFPCVIDRVTKEVGVFAQGQWMPADEWLKSAGGRLR